MKRIGYLFDDITDFSNLYQAYKKARQGKGDRNEVALFELSLEKELLNLQSRLQEGSWQPGKIRQFTLYERKKRLISAAPFVDRVVHHAIMQVLEPHLDKRFIEDTFACRKGKGVHQAVDRYQFFANQFAYVLKLDIRKYFPSVDHELLKGQLGKRVKDKYLQNLLDKIIDHSESPLSDPKIYTPLAAPAEYFPDDDLLTPLSHPLKGSGHNECRVLRGGSWNNNPRNLRSANRNNNSSGNRNNNIGFRLAQSA